MRVVLLGLLLALFSIAVNGVFVPPRPNHHQTTLLGRKQCTWGPSYWCQNLTAAADCHAVKHCIQSVWIHQKLPPDHTSVCQTCLDMVKQARDQLLSNDTQELIKEVFEGSCHLLHIKPIVKECDKIADNYIPELIDTLASEMNPQVVCSVAGLCNNARVHELLQEAGWGDQSAAKPAQISTCDGCHKVVDVIDRKFRQSSRDDVLDGFLRVCSRLGSFSDACSNLIITYFSDLYSYIDRNLNSNDICLLAGECTAQFHQHNTKNSQNGGGVGRIEITPLSDVGYIRNENDDQQEKDDLPCELCEQLVQHLRELLIANTTESEFKLVLQGLCKQTKQFKAECLALVDQYYGEIYNFLVSELNGTVACGLIGICPNSKMASISAPLLPVETASQVQEQQHLKNNQDTVEISPAAKAQLPIELLVPPHQQQVYYNKEVCIFCNYFLHYMQQVITEPHTEDKIRNAIDEACSKLPQEVNSTCRTFVETYEPALVAILAQEMDPSVVCPLLRACPAAGDNVEVFMQAQADPKCPMCLYAVTELESMIKNKKTEENIRSALTKLCSHLSGNMAAECKDFVQTYTDELVEMMIADFKPNEVCVYLKMCSDAKIHPQHIEPSFAGNIQTNEIPDNTQNGKPVDINFDSGFDDDAMSTNGPQCVICQFVMTEIENQLKDKKTDDEIKHVVHNICNVMPKSVKTECNDFVNQYADTVIQLLIQAMEPSEICAVMHLCQQQYTRLKTEVFECALCEVVVKSIEKILANPKVDHTTEHVLEKACRVLPKTTQLKCESLIQTYEDEIILLLENNMPPHSVCAAVGQCSAEAVIVRGKRQVGANHCTWGPSEWCKDEKTARECNALEHCQERVWNQRQKRQVGTNHCTFGPSEWCKDEKTARECNALQHCQEKVWNQRGKRQVGANHCTWGPSEWCKDEQTARECNALQHCQEKVWNQRRKRQVGANHCTWGPSEWCKDEKTARECNALEHCQEKVWNQRQKRQVGTNHCTFGPSEWCKDEKTARECNALQHCQEKVWNQRGKRQVGANHCTWGPSEWCKDEQTARECNALQHCQEKVWNQRQKRQVGTNHCTFGPSEWCKDEKTARECNALQHCQEKVWNQRGKRQVGTNHCTFGPSEWCKDEKTARECNALQHCQEKVWNQRGKRQVGANHCTWGPSEWCKDEQTARECNALQHCQEKVWNQRGKRQVGANHCTWGPSEWCKDEKTARECNALQHCQEKVWNQRGKRQVGANHCTWGPSEWCKDEKTARECNALQHCQEKVWNQRGKRQVGTNHCTFGPSEWCKDEKTARECNALQHCQEKVWNQRGKRQVGANHCTWGPSEWCKDEKTARECNALQHCQEKVWNQRGKRQVGANHCTWGPSEWCKDEKTARECNALQHCQEKVWNQRGKRQIGANHCTWGPSEWCKDEQTAKECNALQHCRERVWNQRGKRQVGANHCTWGPSEWCKDEQTAKECDALQHCQENVWKGTKPK